MSWPILVNIDAKTRKWNLRWINVLPLGEGTGWKVGERGKKTPDIGSGPNFTVLLEIKKMSLVLEDIHNQGYCSWSQQTKDICELPPFSSNKEALDKWFLVIWKRILERGDPAKDNKLRYLGEAAANSKKDTYPKGTKSYESNVRQGIRAALQTAFRSITNYPKNSG
jgi:hypothetical protein